MSVLQALFLVFLVQGIMLGGAAVLLIGLADRNRKQFGSAWLRRLWIAVAVLFLVPVRFLLPQAPIGAPAVAVPETLTRPAAVLTGQAFAEPSQHAQEIQPDAVLPQEEADEVIRPAPAVQKQPFLKRIALLEAAALLWVIGVAAVLTGQGIGYALWRRRVSRGAVPLHPSWRRALEEAARQTGTRQPRLAASRSVNSPLVAGILRPVLLVPAGQAPVSAPYMLAHELTHIRCHDVAVKTLLSAVTAVHWYNPAVWMLQRRAGQDIEVHCDAYVLKKQDGTYRDAYARALLTAVRQNRAPALTTCFTLTKQGVKSRLAALWDTAPKRRGRFSFLLIMIGTAFLGTLVACSRQPESSVPPTPVESEPVQATTPAPVQDHSGRETAWADVSIGNVNNTEYLPEWPKEFPNCRWASYSAPNELRCGFAMPKGDGTVEFYINRDWGKQYTIHTVDLSAQLGTADFCIPNFQMVSDTTGFAVAALDGSMTMYDTTADVVTLRTTDGGETWQVTGRHTLPENTAHDSWHTQPFLWLNETVGFWLPHTDYSTFCVWRTTDGGASWQALDLQNLLQTEEWRNLPLSEMDGGIHTCVVRRGGDLGFLADGGQVRIRCTALAEYGARNNSDPANSFWIVSEDYGETWHIQPYFTMAGVETNAVQRDEYAAVERVAADWHGQYDHNPRYAQTNLYRVDIVPPSEYPEDLIGDWNFSDVSETMTVKEYFEASGALLVRVDFYAEYTFEIMTLGPQYSDGDISIYYLVEPERAHCFTGWQFMEGGTSPAVPEQSAEAQELGLTQRQFGAMGRQVQALYNAGITEVKDSAPVLEQLEGQQIYNYLSLRCTDFGYTVEELCQPYGFASTVLHIDFTALDINDAMNRNDLVSEDQYAYTGYANDTVTAQYTRRDDTIVATVQYGERPPQEYVFRISEAEESPDWFAHPYLVSARAVA